MDVKYKLTREFIVSQCRQHGESLEQAKQSAIAGLNLDAAVVQQVIDELNAEAAANTRYWTAPKASARSTRPMRPGMRPGTQDPKPVTSFGRNLRPGFLRDPWPTC